MSHSWHDITIGEHLPMGFNSIVEIPIPRQNSVEP